MELRISIKAWRDYINALSGVSKAATLEMIKYFTKEGFPLSDQEVEKMIAYAYGLATKYGEAAGALACEMYDMTAAASRAAVAAAEPAATATYQEVAIAVMGTSKTQNVNLVSNSVGRLVKMAGVDSTMKNALRDGAEWAWIPWGDTCPFCLALASRGWQRASRKAIRKGHAEHIHANCNCTYAIRFGSNGDVEGYDPSEYKNVYDSAAGIDSRAKINSLRRQFYEEHREKIREQQNDAYMARNLFTDGYKNEYRK